MKAFYKIAGALAVAAALLTFSSCNKQEVELPPLTQPGTLQYESDFGSVSLMWTAVPEAGQYQYIVENSLHYIVAKGFTTATSVTVKSLQPATTYTVRIKAIPKGVDAGTYSASDYLVSEVSTAAPKQYDFAWSHPATIYWDWDNQVHKSNKAVFGYDKTLKAYVIQAWGGVIGMDVVFTLSDKNEWLINYDESTAYTGGPDGNMAVGLAHGIGGTSAANCRFYTNNTGSTFEGNETGGHAEAWMFNPDGNWTGYYLDYGQYTPPEPTPEPPFVPVADAEESWSAEAVAAFGSEELGTATVSFDAETGVYTVQNWYGVEGHDIAFTRNAETGNWIIDTEASSAYIDGPYKDTGVYELSHGKYGKGMASTLLLDPSDSGFEGDPSTGDLWAKVTSPSGETGTYTLKWKPMDPFKWSCDIYVAGEKLDGKATIAYDPTTGEYTLDAWHGVPGYGLVFTLSDSGEWLIDYEKSSAYLSGPDGNTALGLANGLTDRNCWFYENNTGSWLTGDSKSGTAGCWMYNYLGNWSEYRIEWKEGSWSAEAEVITHDLTMPGKAIISYNVDTQEYTIDSWYGVEGYNIVFTLNGDGTWNLDMDKSTAYLSGPDDNQAVGLAHGVEGAGAGNCWYYVNNTGSWFDGNPVHGETGCWMYNHEPAWTYYKIVW